MRKASCDEQLTRRVTGMKYHITVISCFWMYDHCKKKEAASANIHRVETKILWMSEICYWYVSGHVNNSVVLQKTYAINMF